MAYHMDGMHHTLQTDGNIICKRINGWWT